MKRPIRKILCPIDFSDTASDALRAGIELAEKFGASVEVVHVVVVPHPSTPAIADSLREHAKETLDDFLRHWPKTEVPMTSALVEGAPAAAIAEQAKASDADMIVASSHGRSGFTRAMLGSVTERLVRIAPCPVLTIPADKDA